MKIFVHIALLLSTLLLCNACLEEPDCVSSTTDFVNVSFYDLETNQPDSLSVNSLTIVGSDSILVTDRDIIKVRLPLDPAATQSTFAFDTNLGRDTLTLNYKISTRLISEDCGPESIYKELMVQRNDFDSARVVNTILIENVDEDLQIYN